MAKIEIVTLENADHFEAPGSGPIQSHAFFNKPGDPLRLHVHCIAPGATLDLTASQSDSLVYVWKGAVLVEGVRLEARSSMIIDRFGSARISAGGIEATLLVFGLGAQSAAKGPGERHLHLLPKERVPANWDLSDQGVAGGAIHADASKPEFPLWLHETDFYVGGYEVALHFHSEDEIIFIRDGELHLGDRQYGPGTALAIAAKARYAFRAGPNGLSFANFRGGAPTYSSHDGKHQMDEGEYWRSKVGTPEYVELPAG